MQKAAFKCKEVAKPRAMKFKRMQINIPSLLPGLVTIEVRPVVVQLNSASKQCTYPRNTSEVTAIRQAGPRRDRELANTKSQQVPGGKNMYAFPPGILVLGCTSAAALEAGSFCTVHSLCSAELINCLKPVNSWHSLATTLASQKKKKN